MVADKSSEEQESDLRLFGVAALPELCFIYESQKLFNDLSLTCSFSLVNMFNVLIETSAVCWWTEGKTQRLNAQTDSWLFNDEVKQNNKNNLESFHQHFILFYKEATTDENCHQFNNLKSAMLI